MASAGGIFLTPPLLGEHRGSFRQNECENRDSDS